MIELFRKNSMKLIVGSIASALIAIIIVYLIIGPYNYNFVELLIRIREQGTALYMCVIIFPGFLLLFFIANLVEVILKNRKK